ncbi:MAG TPA: GDP-mannose 4,6-dehydratase [Solirubrobacteraceae bacterium]|jgi:UDP-glucose 4-epimerase|nr:GDP-mannose 4,6-dehydratase [Solirubrobacteraceae bacterium]
MASETVLVTGGAGFIGSHLVDALLADGNRVVIVDDLSSGKSERCAPEADLEVVDIADAGALDAVVDQARPTRIFHLGAQASVVVSVQDPHRDCAVNVVGTLNVLQAAGRHGAPVVFTSTGGALYGDRAPMPTAEDWIPAPLAPYGASKWAAEAYLVTWREASGIPHSVCRLGNVYGPRQSPHGEAGVVAIFTHHLWKGIPPKLFGDGHPTRDYVHVSDVVAALIAASGAGGTYNVATGTEVDVRTIFESLRATAGVQLEAVLAPLRTGELERSCLDPSRAARELGWHAVVGLDDGLASTYHALVDEFHAPPAQPAA